MWKAVSVTIGQSSANMSPGCHSTHVRIVVLERKGNNKCGQVCGGKGTGGANVASMLYQEPPGDPTLTCGLHEYLQARGHTLLCYTHTYLYMNNNEVNLGTCRDGSTCFLSYSVQGVRVFTGL